jgi:PTS system nitrogen regulatory IIA component
MTTTTSPSLAALIRRGGIYHHIPGGSPRETLAQLSARLPPISGLTPERLLEAILERETLMSTGIGNGIALPHPRIPVLGENHNPFVSIAFPEAPLNWNTPDNSPVHTLFLIVSVSAKQHLHTLSRIHFLCRQEPFLTLLKEQAAAQDIISAAARIEAAWA